MKHLLVTLLGSMLLFCNLVHADALSDGENANRTALTTFQKGQIWDQAIHILGGNANVTSRWVGPVRFSVVVGDGTERQKFATDVALDVVEEITTLTSLPLSVVRPEYAVMSEYVQALKQSELYQLLPCKATKQCANLVVVLADIPTMREIANAIPLRKVFQQALENSSDVVCFFAPFQRASVIKQALVFVREDLPGSMIRTCLQEEIYQSFGLFNDYTDSEYFSFNNRVEEKNITRYDQALLQSMYEFEPGAPAFAVVKHLMNRLK